MKNKGKVLNNFENIMENGGANAPFFIMFQILVHYISKVSKCGIME